MNILPGRNGAKANFKLTDHCLYKVEAMQGNQTTAVYACSVVQDVVALHPVATRVFMYTDTDYRCVLDTTPELASKQRNREEEETCRSAGDKPMVVTCQRVSEF